jgi:hypothetical protein
MVIMKRKAQLLEIVRARHSPGSFANFLDGRKQEANQDRDNRDDHEEFDQRKTAGSSCSVTGVERKREHTRTHGRGEKGVLSG